MAPAVCRDLCLGLKSSNHYSIFHFTISDVVVSEITHARPSLFSSEGSQLTTHPPKLRSWPSATELLIFPSRATVSRRLLPTCPLRRAGATSFRSTSSSGNVEATTDTTSTTASVAKNRQEWRAGRTPFGLGLDLSEEMRREMLWRMLAPPAAAVAAEAVFLAALNSGAAALDAPAWAGKAGSAVLFVAGLLGSQYGFFSSRWDVGEEAGSVVGWKLAVRHWSALSVVRDSSVEEDDDEEEEEDDDEWEYYEDDEEEEDD